jgi:acyl transferase domain-containing protein
MGHRLYHRFQAYQQAVDEALAAFDLPELAQALRTGTGPDGILDRTEYTQPALFTVELGIHRLLASHGITPDLLAGHSLGEITAAHLASVLTLTDACTLVKARASLMQQLPAGGVMAALEASEDEVLPLLPGRDNELSLAAINGAASVVVSGTDDAVGELVDLFAAEGRKTRRLHVSHAFHSPLVEPMLTEFRKAVATLNLQPAQLPVVSNVTGQLADPNELSTPDYWIRHARATVRFHDTLHTLTDAGATTFVEAGPGSVLSALTGATVPTTATVTPTLPHDQDEITSLTTSLARLHTTGTTVDWTPLLPTTTRHIDLPTYPFQHQHYWLSAGTPRARDATRPEPSCATDLPGLVLAHLRAVLGHPDDTAVDPAASFLELGVGSLSAVELRNRLSGALGMPLAATVVFDHSTPAALAAYLREARPEGAAGATACIERHPAGANDGIAGEGQKGMLKEARA